MTNGRPLMAAQKMELDARWAAYNEGPQPKPGDYVRQKHGLGFVKVEFAATVLLVFWRYLDPEDPVDILIIGDQIDNHANHNRFDCIIANISNDGETQFTTMDSRMFRTLTAEELAAL